MGRCMVGLRCSRASSILLKWLGAISPCTENVGLISPFNQEITPKEHVHNPCDTVSPPYFTHLHERMAVVAKCLCERQGVFLFGHYNGTVHERAVKLAGVLVGSYFREHEGVGVIAAEVVLAAKALWPGQGEYLMLNPFRVCPGNFGSFFDGQHAWTKQGALHGNSRGERGGCGRG